MGTTRMLPATSAALIQDWINGNRNSVVIQLAAARRSDVIRFAFLLLEETEDYQSIKSLTTLLDLLP